MGTGSQDTFTELGPMRPQAQEVDNYMWTNNVNMNSNNMGQYGQHPQVGHNGGSNGMGMSTVSNGASTNQPNMGMPPPAGYPYQNGMRMQNSAGAGCLVGSNAHLNQHPQNIPASTHTQTLHGMTPHSNGTPLNGRSHLVQHMLGGYMDDKMQGYVLSYSL